VDLHRKPELSLQEARAAEKIADQLRQPGFDVIIGVGGTGVVGILGNSLGPTVMIRGRT
jgi:metal-dependent amidase/aminoacylase/carboxypeptidase family protein